MPRTCPPIRRARSAAPERRRPTTSPSTSRRAARARAQPLLPRRASPPRRPVRRRPRCRRRAAVDQVARHVRLRRASHQRSRRVGGSGAALRRQQAAGFFVRQVPACACSTSTRAGRCSGTTRSFGRRSTSPSTAGARARGGLPRRRPPTSTCCPGPPATRTSASTRSRGPTCGRHASSPRAERAAARLSSTRLTSPIDVAQAQILQENLKADRARLEIKQLPFPVRFEKLGTPGEPFDLGRVRWFGAPPTTSSTSSTGARSASPATCNLSYFNSPKYNRLLDQASRLNGDRALPGLRRARRADLARRAPAIPISVVNTLAFVSARVGCVVDEPVPRPDRGLPQVVSWSGPEPSPRRHRCRQAMPLGRLPTGIVSTTSPYSGSIRDTVPSPPFATQTARRQTRCRWAPYPRIGSSSSPRRRRSASRCRPPRSYPDGCRAHRDAARPRPTEGSLTSLAVRGLMRETVLSPALVTHTDPSPTGDRGGTLLPRCELDGFVAGSILTELSDAEGYPHVAVAEGGCQRSRPSPRSAPDNRVARHRGETVPSSPFAIQTAPPRS